MLFWIVLQASLGSAGLLLKVRDKDSRTLMRLVIGRIAIILLLAAAAWKAIALDWPEEQVFAISLIGHPVLYVCLEVAELVWLRASVSLTGIVVSLHFAILCAPLFMVFAAI